MVGLKLRGKQTKFCLGDLTGNSKYKACIERRTAEDQYIRTVLVGSHGMISAELSSCFPQTVNSSLSKAFFWHKVNLYLQRHQLVGLWLF
jgi:hypothetical protein